MAQNPWFKFYPADWRSDVALKGCSLAARGLWIEMIGLMHESPRYGHLVVGGRIVDVDHLSALVGATTQELSDLLGQLEEAGVFTRGSDSSIYSRRMVRDYQRSNTNRKNIKNRWKKDNNKKGESPPTQPPDFIDKKVVRITKPDTRKKPRGIPPQEGNPDLGKQKNFLDGESYPDGSWQKSIIGEHGLPTFKSWFVDAVSDGRRLTLPTKFKADWVRNNYGFILRQHGISEIVPRL